MGILLTPFGANSLCEGCTWTVANIDLLADQIARVAVGQAEHVAEILAQAGIATAGTTADAVVGAVELLTAVGDPYHRDGWMFQVMSWLAAHRRTPGGLIRVPQMILADKGFDGIQIEVDPGSGAVTAVVIFEDKATENPRATIRDYVWPEFQGLEAGKKQNVLVSEVTSLLKANANPNATAAVETIIWAEARRYRVSITVTSANATGSGLASLFSGFDAVAPGSTYRRRGEILVEPNLRPWMQQLAELAISKARGLGV